MRKLVKVQGVPGLARDPNTNAILNTDSAGYAAYKHRKRLNAKKDQRLDKLERDMSEIKTLLQQLVSKASE
jgi:hypothetical protein